MSPEGLRSEAVTDVDHREKERSRVWLPVSIRSDAGESFGVTYDVSEKGLLVLAPGALDVGAKVTLTIEVPTEPSRTLVAAGHVVHAGPNEADPGGLWRYRVGIALDDLLGDLYTAIVGLTQTKAYKAPR
jgi:hypothetical protein